MKRAFTLQQVPYLFGLLFIAFLLISSSNNPPNGRTGAPGDGLCSNCHGSQPPNVQGDISLTGLPATIQPNTTYPLTVTFTVTEGSPSTAGFQMLSLNTSNNNAGDFAAISGDVGTNTTGNGREYIEHRGDKSISGNTVSWSFEWTSPASAPGSGDLTLYASGILANNNGSNSGDRTITNTFGTMLASADPLQAEITSSTDVSCFGGNDGSATAAASGGTPPYAFSWSNGQNGATANNLAAGTYTVTVSDSGSGTTTTTVVINQPTQLNAFIASQTNVDCNGNNTGSAQGAANGGTPPYSFSWSNGTNGPNNNNLAANTYILTVFDANGCTATTSLTITEPSELQIAIDSQTNVSCNGDQDGSATASGTGGTGPYSFEWSEGTTTATAFDLGPGTYTITITDANNCTANTSVIITEPEALTLSVTSQEAVNCNGSSEGSAMVEAAGGTSPFTYAWSNGANGPTANNLSAGSYVVTVTDANNCSTTESVTITEPAALQASATNQAVTCFGNCDGSIDLSVTGGVTPYTYAWSGNETTEDLSDLCAGNYSVTVTDANGCMDTLSISVAEPNELVLAATAIIPVDCNGNNTGSASVEASGGTTPYTYAWPSGGTGSTENNLSAGTYLASVTDANGCTSTLQVEITQPAALQANASATGETSAGANDGTAQAAPTGGTTPYSYEWSNGATEASLTGLTPGNYTVTVTDANNCTAIETVSVAAFDCAISVELSKSDVSCNNGADGTSTATVNGGNAPFSFEWSSGSQEATATGLEAGTYTVTVTDDNGCTTTGNVTIVEPDPLSLNISNLSNANCNGANDGSVTLQSDGGTTPYTYNWADGSIEQTRTDLAAGEYNPTVTDANGCTISISLTIAEPNPLVLSETVAGNVTCFGAADGASTVLAGGGTAPYSYAWSDGETGNSRTGLAPATYTVTATDANGCATDLTIEITEPDALQVFVVDSNQPVCADDATGGISVSVEGGTGSFGFLWSNGSTDPDQNNLTAGTYTLTVTDANQCQETLSIELSALDTVAPVVELVPNLNIYLDENGQATLDASQIDAGTSDNCGLDDWVLSQTTFDCGDIGVQNIQATAFDLSGNSAAASTLVAVVDTIAPTLLCPNDIVSTDCNSPVEYTLTFSDNCSIDEPVLVDGIASGSMFPEGITTVAFDLIDQGGAVASCSFTVEIVNTLSITSINVTNASNDGANGAIDLTFSGGTAPFTFIWTQGGNVVGNTEDLSDLESGTYEVEITDALGCSIFSDMVTVDNILSIREESLDQLVVFPNPATETVWITGISDPAIRTVQCIDLRGKVYELPVQGLGNEQVQVSLQELPTGLYLLQVGQQRVRLVVQ
jgi:hypothetical protein